MYNSNSDPHKYVKRLGRRVRNAITLDCETFFRVWKCADNTNYPATKNKCNLSLPHITLLETETPSVSQLVGGLVLLC
jgi:hypothetical protein